jgi:hypothetical protein
MAEPANETVVVQGDCAVATLPEGTRCEMKVSELIRQLAPTVPDTCGAVLPDGTKCALPTRGGVVLVHQTPPQVYGFRWIARDSQAEFGPGTRYRTVRLSLPYVIVLAVFAIPKRGVPVLSERNECYFSNSPLETLGLDTPLGYPALLNCSKIGIGDGGGLPLSWICTQYLPKPETRGHRSLDASFREGLGALLRHLFESGFNRSSEHHEGESGFSASVKAKIDPRIASVEAWEEATREDPLFAIEVPWLPVGKTLREITARGGKPGRGRGKSFGTAADLVRLIFNASAAPRSSS